MSDTFEVRAVDGSLVHRGGAEDVARGIYATRAALSQPVGFFRVEEIETSPEYKAEAAARARVLPPWGGGPR
jgi:hypothetical protein